MSVRHIQGVEYEVDSFSKPGLFYRTYIGGLGATACTCPAWAMKSRRNPAYHCKHIELTLKTMAEEAVKAVGIATVLGTTAAPQS